MTIDKSTLCQGVLKILKSLNESIMDGIVFNGEYMTAMNKGGYERVKLPSYIPDSFVLPTELIIPVLRVKGDTLKITRSERYLTVEGSEGQCIFCFAEDEDIDSAIEEYDR